MSLFTTLTKERMCAEIYTARHHVIWAAPSITMPVVNALLQVSQRLAKGAVQVVLDVSPNVARLGYGEHAAVEKLVAAGISVHQHLGLRIGVLICDDIGWSFATSPILVEADPVVDSDAFNAIALTEAQILVLRADLPTIKPNPQEQLFAEYSVVGTEIVNDVMIKKVKKALEIAPPQAFDLARQTQVYAALIQFVELTLEGFNIQSRRIQLPKTLPLIASQDREVKERVNASLKILDKIEIPKTLQEITKDLEELRQAYLVPVGQAGRVILKSKRQDFENELKAIQKRLDECKVSTEKELQEALNKVINAIVPDLSRAVLADPPSRFRGLFPTTEESAGIYVREELAKSFPKAEDLVSGMKIQKFYKDVTYETLKDKEFSERVMKVIPKSVLDGALLQEEVVAKASTG